jgi:hypothetical protein
LHTAAHSTGTPVNTPIPFGVELPPRLAVFRDAAWTWKRVELADNGLGSMLKIHQNRKATGLMSKRGYLRRDVRQSIYDIRDRLHTMPAISKALPPAKQKKLAALIKKIDQLVPPFENSAHADDLEGTQKIYARVHALLAEIKSLYPSDVLRERG